MYHDDLSPAPAPAREARSSPDAGSADPSKGSRIVGRAEALRRLPELDGEIWDAADSAFPVRLTRGWFEAMVDERDGPMARQALPDARELEIDPGDLDDPVGDAAQSPVPWVVRKHRDRVLMLLTKRCHLYCRYCFRRNHEPGERQDPTADELEAALRYCESSGAEEIILSGGDPLAVTDRKLLGVIDRLRASAPVIRVHSRAPISFPDRVTPELAAALGARPGVWMLVHSNCVEELTEPVRAALTRLVDAGVPVLNQSVLLRGVNDSPETLAALCQALVRLRVFPYYLHHPDRAAGNAHFRVSMEEGMAIWRGLAARVSGIALPKYVIDLPNGSGKYPVSEVMRSGEGEAG